jgi:membrane protein
VNRRHGIFLKQLRIFSLAFKGFRDDNCMVSGTALTFYTLFSIVPILALAFAIAKGFGYEKDLQEQILRNYGEYRDVLNNAFVYANSLLSSTRGGVLASFGIILLLWSVMKLLVSIENSFNEIWEVQRGRSWIRKITDYLTIMLVGPLLLIISGGLTVTIQTKIDSFTTFDFVSVWLVKLFAFCLVAGVFTFLYMALPNIKVTAKAAISAALVSGIFFELLGWAYVNFQIGANQMNAIYGGFAALPLFLIWVQYSWYIVLFGAELAYANQNVDHYELEDEIQNISARYKKAMSLVIANLVAKRFYNHEKPLNAVGISETLDIPSRLTRNILNEFVQTGIFVEVRTETDKEIVYQPGITESQLTVQNILETLEKKGVNELPISDSTEMLHVSALMQQMERAFESEMGHMLVRDII